APTAVTPPSQTDGTRNTKMIDDPSSILGVERNWLVSYAHTFHFPRNLAEIAADDWVRDYAMTLTADETAILAEYERFGHIENPIGACFELCTNSSGEVFALSMEHMGLRQFSCWANASIEQFVDSFELLDRHLANESWPPSKNDLLRSLLELVRIDQKVSEGTYWWEMIKWTLEQVDDWNELDDNAPRQT
ncbi:MAG: hypothetical protein AAF497_22330, partial [Planctomycetota bacterium]